MKTTRYDNQPIALAITIVLFMSAAPAYAGIGGDHERNAHQSSHDKGGNVLSAKAEPKGYTLSDLAKATAAFNVGSHAGAFPNIVDGKPFQGLFLTEANPTNTFDVSTDTILYVPVFFNDDSAPIIGHFPNVNNQNALAKYTYSSKELGVEYANITIDGKTTSLDDNYLVGVKFNQALPDGANQYMVFAAFVSPLKKGTHTVEISTLVDGAAITPWCTAINALYGFTVCTTEYKFSDVYNVIVH
jgi:hypothetical protein